MCVLDSMLSNIARKHITVYAVHASISIYPAWCRGGHWERALHLLEDARYNHQHFFGGYPLVN